jgi:hypothetical protein
MCRETLVPEAATMSEQGEDRNLMGKLSVAPESLLWTPYGERTIRLGKRARVMRSGTGGPDPPFQIIVWP